jgi:hypothetical protein
MTPIVRTLLATTLLSAVGLLAPLSANASSNVPAPFTSQAALTKALTDASTMNTLPSHVVPSITQAATDYTGWAGCLTPYTSGPSISAWAGVSKCGMGEWQSKKTVVLFGDSQAWMWGDDLDLLGHALGYRVVQLTRAACEVADTPLWDYHSLKDSKNCTAFRQSALKEIASLHPVGVIVADLKPTSPEDLQQHPIGDAAYTAALSKTMKALRAITPNVIMLGGHPVPGEDPTTCMATHPTHITGCAMSLSQAAPSFADATYRAVAQATGAHYHTPISWFCSATFCPLVADKTLIYTDQYHITRTYALRLMPLLKKILVADHIL